MHDPLNPDKMYLFIFYNKNNFGHCVINFNYIAKLNHFNVPLQIILFIHDGANK